MNLSNANPFTVAIGLVLFSTLISFTVHDEKLRYSQKPTILFEEDERLKVNIYHDSLSRDSLFGVKTNDHIPIHYFKQITTNVCFDNECRLLKIKVYWNITGRYLGFELTDGEFLSKRDHEPFSDKEYKRLNDLLADPTLPLGGISFEKLIEVPTNMQDSVDGVTGATTLAVSQMVVKGAAYTTYTLWNIVHGPTKDWVSSLTEMELTPDLIGRILKSSDMSDRAWMLNRIGPETILTPEIRKTLLSIIAGDDFFMSYTAIHAIKTPHLNSDTLQIALFLISQEADHGIQRMVIEKLKEAPKLNVEVINYSRRLLHQLNGKQLGDILGLYTEHSVSDLETNQAVAEILKNDNRFISRQAYKFLKGVNITDKKIEGLLKQYERKINK